MPEHDSRLLRIFHELADSAGLLPVAGFKKVCTVYFEARGGLGSTHVSERALFLLENFNLTAVGHFIDLEELKGLFKAEVAEKGSLPPSAC
jgi:hypothetical protein